MNISSYLLPLSGVALRQRTIEELEEVDIIDRLRCSAQGYAWLTYFRVRRPLEQEGTVAAAWCVFWALVLRLQRRTINAPCCATTSYPCLSSKVFLQGVRCRYITAESPHTVMSPSAEKKKKKKTAPRARACAHAPSLQRETSHYRHISYSTVRLLGSLKCKAEYETLVWNRPCEIGTGKHSQSALHASSSSLSSLGPVCRNGIREEREYTHISCNLRRRCGATESPAWRCEEVQRTTPHLLTPLQNAQTLRHFHELGVQYE